MQDRKNSSTIYREGSLKINSSIFHYNMQVSITPITDGLEGSRIVYLLLTDSSRTYYRYNHAVLQDCDEKDVRIAIAVLLYSAR